MLKVHDVLINNERYYYVFIYIYEYVNVLQLYFLEIVYASLTVHVQLSRAIQSFSTTNPFSMQT